MIRLHLNGRGGYFVRVIPTSVHWNLPRVSTPYGFGYELGDWFLLTGKRCKRVRLDREPANVYREGHIVLSNSIILPPECVEGVRYDDERSMLDEALGSISVRRQSFHNYSRCR